MKPGIDLDFLGKGKDHELSMEAKVSMMFGVIFGERESGKLTVPGLIHKVDGIVGVKKNDKGQDEQTKMALGLSDVVQVLEHDQSLMAKQVIAICRILKIDPKILAHYSNDHVANLEYDNETGKEIQEIIKKIKEATPQGEKTNA